MFYTKRNGRPFHGETNYLIWTMPHHIKCTNASCYFTLIASEFAFKQGNVSKVRETFFKLLHSHMYHVNKP